MDARQHLAAVIAAAEVQSRKPTDAFAITAYARAVHAARNFLSVPEMEPVNAGVPTHMEINMPAQTVSDLATLAIDIALTCPLDRPSQPGYYTYVSRDTVREIRRVLESAGIPWKLQHKELRK